MHMLQTTSHKMQGCCGHSNDSEPLRIFPSRNTTTPASICRSYAAANRGGGTGKAKKKGNNNNNNKKKGKRSHVPSLLMDFETSLPSRRGRGGGGVRAKKSHEDNLYAVRSMFESLLEDSSDDDDDDDDVFKDIEEDDNDTDAQSNQWYEKAVQALQTNSEVRLNLGAPIRVGPITSQASMTEFHQGRPKTSHQYTFGVTGAQGRATARMNLVNQDANLELELFNGQTFNISLNTVVLSSSSSSSSSSTTTMIEVTSTSRRFSPSNRSWNDDDDVIEAEIVEKIVEKKERSID